MSAISNDPRLEGPRQGEMTSSGSGEGALFPSLGTIGLTLEGEIIVLTRGQPRAAMRLGTRSRTMTGQ